MHLAIFRYPGGKSRLLKPIFDEISTLSLVPPGQSHEVFHDVFVGGGSVLIHVAQQHPKARLHANDLDKNVFSFWELVAFGSPEEAKDLEKLLAQKPTMTLFNNLRATPPMSRVERAYYAVFFNRTTFSGISSAGAIGGLNQKSKWTVDCRYNADRLIHEFRELRTLFQGRLKVTNLDCFEYLKRLEAHEACYLDPPYYLQGKALYEHWMTPADHKRLSEVLRRRRNWVLSYDNCKEIQELYDWCPSADLDVRYSMTGVKTTWNATKECLFRRGPM